MKLRIKRLANYPNRDSMECHLRRKFNSKDISEEKFENFFCKGLLTNDGSKIKIGHPEKLSSLEVYSVEGTGTLPRKLKIPALTNEESCVERKLIIAKHNDGSSLVTLIGYNNSCCYRNGATKKPCSEISAIVVLQKEFDSKYSLDIN